MAQKCSQQQQTGGAGSRTTTNIHIITNIQRQIQTQYELKLQIHKYITYTPALSNQPRGGASSKALCYTLEQIEPSWVNFCSIYNTLLKQLALTRHLELGRL